jgi:hypothetical protein
MAGHRRDRSRTETRSPAELAGLSHFRTGIKGEEIEATPVRLSRASALEE